MKKSGFVQGAAIATLGIIATKILGLLYVIPFHAIVGEKGGALYGYAYTIYDMFLSLSSIGIPLAVSKLVSEYNALGYYHAKERAYRLALKIIITMSIISFLVLFIFAPLIADQIIGNVSGGNTMADITYVVRIAAFALLFVASLAVIRGYLQGHKFFAASSISEVIEQLARVIILLAGSYSALRIFHLGLTKAVGIAVFGACGGAVVAIIYLLTKIKKAQELKPVSYKETAAEEKITDKVLARKIMTYALPFIYISIITSSYNIVDMMTVVKTLYNYAHFTATDAEAVMSSMTTWGSKLNNIVVSVSTGVTVSLIPHVASSFVKKDMKDVSEKINKSMEMVLYTTFPLATGLSLLAAPVWYVFYGTSKFGPSVFWFTVLLTLFNSLFMDVTIVTQSLNEYKTVFISLFVGFIWNAIMNVPMMKWCYNVGIQSYRGATIASMIGFVFSIAISLTHIHRKYKINYKETFKSFAHVLFADLMMILVIMLFKNIVPITNISRSMSVLVIIFYTIIGAVTYLGITYYDKTMINIFGKEYLDKLLVKMHLKKVKTNE